MSPTSTPLPMYDFSELTGANRALWQRFEAIARSGGFAGDIPVVQVCGYPLVTGGAGPYEALAIPVYDVPYSSGAAHCGLIVTGGSRRYGHPGELRGTRFALNARDSNTGMNLPRRLFAPLAERGRFFEAVIETGSHAASLTALRLGVADAASIDNVTFALLAEHRPAAVEGVRVLAPTASGPALPFVVPAGTEAPVRELLFGALARAIDELRGSAPFDALHLARVERAPAGAYDVLLRWEREASDLGYGTLA